MSEAAPRELPITVGDVAPMFDLTAVDTGGEQLKVRMPEVAEGGPVLLIFYQDDGMPICTRELTAIALD